jgi:cyclophilin family peptidyl-prolyl cis-trans isomerase
MYITLAAQPKLDGQFTVFGQVTSGMDVVRKLAVNDIVRRVTVKP